MKLYYKKMPDFTVHHMDLEFTNLEERLFMITVELYIEIFLDLAGMLSKEGQ